MNKIKKRIIVGIAVFLFFVVAFFTGIPEKTEKEIAFDAKKTQEKVIANQEVSSSEIPKETPILPTEKSADDLRETPEELPGLIQVEGSENTQTNTGAEQSTESEQPTDVPTEFTCTLSVRCDEVFQNLELLTEGKETIIPPNGVVFPEQTVMFSEGESVFDVLLREMTQNQIHLEFVDTPMYHSVYIEGIGNLYEFDCGDYSGWMYRVNGIEPTYGCSQYKLQNGDKIEFFYSCHL